ncbi:Nitrogen permease regulator 3-like protein [Trichoplax sp. H2]|nr:Nitrogen permease regulator 3-like protein [Trichoplax sp. H2]|eukprot:RDD38722.1 Nitrogen permease regulator 3-like protein [Trichoplax sp. H2]
MQQATAGNTGEKLYFKYPYSPFLHKKKANKQGTSLTDKHIVDPFHFYDFVLCPWSIGLFALKEDQQELRSRSVSFTSNNFTPDSYIDCPLWSFSDSLLASILSPKEAMCNKNFELAIDDILFIGYPTIMKDAENPITASSASGSPASSFKGPATTNLLHITFVLQVGAPPGLIDAFHKLSQRIAAAIKHEQLRRGYLSKEVDLLSFIYDKYSDHAEGETNYSVLYEKIIDESLLAHQLKQLYDHVTKNELIQFKINNWIDITFNVSASLRGGNEYLSGIDDPDEICQKIQPYHSLMMLTNPDNLIRQLPGDCSPALVRLIQVISPFRGLLALAFDADLTLNQVKHLASHLVFWGKASIIYPICETNVYILTPEAPIDISSPLMEEFSNQFVGLFMPVFMSEFSAALRPLKEHIEKFNLSKDMLGKIVIWMLKNRVIMQQHRYILLICKLEIRELNFELYENKLSEEDAERLSRQLPNLAYLTDSHKATIMKYVGTKQKEEIQFFIRLCKYFDGRHHIEDIMYWENLPRDEIFEILNRFNEITITFWLRDIVTIAT